MYVVYISTYVHISQHGRVQSRMYSYYIRDMRPEEKNTLLTHCITAKALNQLVLSHTGNVAILSGGNYSMRYYSLLGSYMVI